MRQKLCLLDDLGFDLVTRLLTANPQNRKACRYLLSHPWFDDVKSELKRFEPWYRGFEQDILRMVEIDRMPPARPLEEVSTSDSAAADMRNKRKGCSIEPMHDSIDLFSRWKFAIGGHGFLFVKILDLLLGSLLRSRLDRQPALYCCTT